MSPELPWFALAVVPRKEKAAARTLRIRGYEEFLPLYSMRRKWSDRVKTVEEPLFPGYVFCRLDPALRLPILKIESVLHVLGLGNTPQPLDPAEVESLRTVCASGIQAVPCPYLTAGNKVRVNDGPLTGVEGIIVDAQETRLILSVSLLQRSVSVTVDREWIEPVRYFRAF